jgi:hypothetical protein
MTIDFLGYGPARFQGAIRDVPIFAMWLDSEGASITAQVPEPLACPSCGRSVDLSPITGDETFRRPEIYSTALGCVNCGATLHFDKTPADKRASLTWTKRYRKVK